MLQRINTWKYNKLHVYTLCTRVYMYMYNAKYMLHVLYNLRNIDFDFANLERDCPHVILYIWHTTRKTGPVRSVRWNRLVQTRTFCKRSSQRWWFEIVVWSFNESRSATKLAKDGLISSGGKPDDVDRVNGRRRRHWLSRLLLWLVCLWQGPQLVARNAIVTAFSE